MLKIKVFEFGGPPNTYIVVLEASKTLINFCDRAKKILWGLLVALQARGPQEFVTGVTPCHWA